MSDENSSEPSGSADAGQGAEATPPVKPRSEMTELENAIHRRDLATARAAKLEAETRELRAQLKAAGQGGPGAISEPPQDWKAAFEGLQAQMSEKLSELTGMFQAHQASAAQKAVETHVLTQVPEGNRSTASALLGTLGIDFTSDGAADAALEKLRTQHPAVLFDPARAGQPRAPQKRPDGSIDLSAYRTFADVPDAYKPLAMRDPKEFERLTGRAQGPRGDGLNI